MTGARSLVFLIQPRRSSACMLFLIGLHSTNYYIVYWDVNEFYKEASETHDQESDSSCYGDGVEFCMKWKTTIIFEHTKGREQTQFP